MQEGLQISMRPPAGWEFLSFPARVSLVFAVAETICCAFNNILLLLVNRLNGLNLSPKHFEIFGYFYDKFTSLYAAKVNAFVNMTKGSFAN